MFKIINTIYNLFTNSRSYYTNSALWRINNNTNIIELVVLNSPMPVSKITYDTKSKNYRLHMSRLKKLGSLIPTNRVALKINP
jgi:hypothetical protein